MQRFLMRCLILNLVAVLASGALVWWYPKDNGFSLSRAAQTSYIPGGVFLGSVLVCLVDLAIGVAVGWRISHPH
jgi:hypothetical protein